jgi:aryl-alcohol dehydrogenase-like predicted oxidoreductase
MLSCIEYRRLGGSGLKVSSIGLGMMSYGDPELQRWALPEDRAEPIVRRAVECGITFFDTADMYSDGASEIITGRLLAKLFSRREDYVVATKVFYPTGPGPNDRGLSAKHIHSAVDASLQRLSTGYIDLYQVHRFDPETPVAETMIALHDVVRSGKARYIGASGMAAWQFAKLQAFAGTQGLTQFVSMQDRYNLVNREDERELLPMCRDMGVGVIPYSPLARGLLAGTRERGGESHTLRASTARPDRPADFDVLDAVRAVASDRGVSPAAISLAWLMSRPGVAAPIVGATAERHINDAVAAATIELTADEVAALELPYLPRLAVDYA